MTKEDLSSAQFVPNLTYINDLRKYNFLSNLDTDLDSNTENITNMINFLDKTII